MGKKDKEDKEKPKKADEKHDEPEKESTEKELKSDESSGSLTSGNFLQIRFDRFVSSTSFATNETSTLQINFFSFLKIFLMRMNYRRGIECPNKGQEEGIPQKNSVIHNF